MEEKAYDLQLIDRLLPVVGQLENYFAQMNQLKQQNETLLANSERVMANRRMAVKLPFYFVMGAISIFMLVPLATHSLLSILFGVAMFFGGRFLYDRLVQPRLDAIAVHPNVLRQMEENNTAIKEIDNQAGTFYLQNADLLRQFPEDYQYTEALSFIRKTLQNRRADSLKEAINLYEDVLYRRNMSFEMERQHQEQIAYLKTIQAETTRAANNAGSAAFWGALDFLSNT